MMDLRNGFVHYKWALKEEGAMDQDDEDLKRSVTAFEGTVKYLTRYESRRVYFSSRAKARRGLGKLGRKTTRT